MPSAQRKVVRLLRSGTLIVSGHSLLFPHDVDASSNLSIQPTTPNTNNS